ncbi:MAG: glycine betaine/L-proline ABC transporter ATP-binding protein, partial [Pseudomonadota bacterium]
MSQPAVISCEDLWMVFGDGAARHKDKLRGPGSPHDIAEGLKADGLIPAVRGVSFDVKAGELFV